MLQRIQTLHLLIVMALTATMLFPNYATIMLASAGPSVPTEITAADGSVVRTTTVQDEDGLIFNLWGITGLNEQEQILSTTPMIVLVIITLLVAFVTIFLYRKRWIQVRLCFAMAIMLLGIGGFIAMYIYKLTQVLDAMQMTYAIKYSVFDLVPILTLVFIYLAFRGISKDIALIRSLDRIR